MKALTADPTAATGVTSVVPAAVSYGAGSPGSYTLTGLVIGQAYCWIPGANETSIVVNANVTLAKADLPTGGCFTATATTASMKGTGSAAVTAIVSPTTILYPTTVTPTLPVRQITLGQFPAANPNWIRQIQASDQYIFVKRAPSYAVAISLADVVNIALSQEINLTWTPPLILTQPAATTVAHTVQASLVVVPGSEYVLTYAWYETTPVTTTVGTTITWSSTALIYSSTTGLSTATITSSNTIPSDGDTVKVGEKIYTFKTTLTPTEGQVLINGSADAALLNLIRAINHSGTANTDYKCAAAHPAVSAATSVTAHAFVVTAKALTTTGIYDVATAGTLKITPTDTSLTCATYYCTITDDAAAYGLANGSVTTSAATLTVT